MVDTFVILYYPELRMVVVHGSRTARASHGLLHVKCL